jgi:hypothetical protein
MIITKQFDITINSSKRENDEISFKNKLSVNEKNI